MFKRFDICILLFLALNALYWVVVSSLNSCAGGVFYIAVPALFIVPAALYMNFLSMASVVVFSALASFSVAGVNSFLVCALWLAAAWLVNVCRFRLRTGDAMTNVSLALAVNTFIIVGYAFILPCGVCGFGEYAKRLVFDAAASGLFILIAADFCIKLPVQIMDYFGVDITMGEEL